MRVYFTYEGDDPPLLIVSGEVEAVIFPATTNEYLKIKMVDIESGNISMVEKKTTEVFRTAKEARQAALIELYVQLDNLRQKFSCLGDHCLAESHWKKR